MNLIEVLHGCCDVLKSFEMKPEERKRFLEAAWDLVTCLAYEIIDKIETARPAGAPMATPASGSVEVVPVETSLFVAILLARRRRAPNLQNQVDPPSDDAVARGRGEVRIGGKDARGDFFRWEPGADEDDALVDFERLLWPIVFANHVQGTRKYDLKCDKKRCDCACDILDCDRKLLYSKVRIDKQEPRFVLVGRGKGSKWGGLASSFPQIAFIERSGSVARTMGIDEQDVAQLIKKFVNLS